MFVIWGLQWNYLETKGFAETCLSSSDSCTTHNLSLGLALLHANSFLQQMSHGPGIPDILGSLFKLKSHLSNLTQYSLRVPL